MADGWADSEVERTLDAYFAMFRLELMGERFSKVDFCSTAAE